MDLFTGKIAGLRGILATGAASSVANNDSRVQTNSLCLTKDICGPEAACTIVSSDEYRCLCPHDSSEPTPDLKCPIRKLSKSPPDAIHDVLPPNRNKSPMPTESPSTQQMNMPATTDTIFLSIIGFLCLTVLALGLLMWWKRNSLVNCLRRAGNKNCKRQGPPMTLAKGMLLAEQYATNPNYYSTSSDIATITVTVIPKNKLHFLQEIGEGCFGKVYKGEYAMHCDGENAGTITTVAIKVLKESASSEAEDDFLREVEIMSSFRHDNILSLVGVVLKETGRTPWMVFEFMPYGDLAGVLRCNSRQFWQPLPGLPSLTKRELHSVATQISSGMSYLSSQHFVHRDLACRNCLVGDNLNVKISDFGMSRDIYTCDYYKIGGSRMLPVRWMSPESVMYGRFTLESDVWSYGIVLWEIYSYGKQPYYGHSNEEVVKLILQGIMLIPPEDCPPFVCNIMRECWKTEPRDRIKFAAIHERLLQYFPCDNTPSVSQQSSPPASVHKRPLQYAEILSGSDPELLDSENYLLPKPTLDYILPIPD